MCRDIVFNDIKIINDSEIDERVNFIIKCEDGKQLKKLQNIFSTDKKQITFKAVLSFLKNEQPQLRY